MNTREPGMTVATGSGLNDSGKYNAWHRRVSRCGLTLIEMLVVMIVIVILCSLLLPAVQQARDVARRYSCRHNLMQIGLALRSYESTFDSLPPGSVDSVRPIKNVSRGYHVGWMVRILPHLDQTSRFKQFDFSVSVYDPKNSNAVAVRMPSLHCPSAYSTYAGCHHDVESPIDIDNTGVLFLNTCISQDDVLDGISHTIFVGEKNDGELFGWASGTRDTLRNTGTPIISGQGKPAGAVAAVVAAEQQSTLYVGGFGSTHGAGANFLFGDGSVQFINQSIAMPAYQQLGHRADRGLASADF